MAIPVGYETPPTMETLIQQYVRHEVSQAASAAGEGTFEEEDDFSLDEHYPLPMENYDVNEYEMSDDPEMPSTAPVEDPPPETAPAVVDGSPEPPETPAPPPTDPK